MKISHYCFELDYNDFRACQYGSSCCDDDYCRCGKIEDIVIKSINSEDLISELKYALVGEKHYNWSAVENYCFSKLFNIMEMNDAYKYSIHTCGGYYGEELNGATCDFWIPFEKESRKMMDLNDDDKIRFVLEKEHGHVFEELAKSTFTQKLVKRDDIIQPDNFQADEEEYCDFYSAIFICKQVGSQYQIIDGHNRWERCSHCSEVFILVAN